MNHHRPHFSTSQGKSDLSYWLIQWHHLSFPDKEILPNPDLCWLSHSLNKGIRLWNWRLKIMKCLLVCSALMDGWCLESTISFFRRNKNIKFNHSETDVSEEFVNRYYLTYNPWHLVLITLHYSDKIELHIPISDFYKIGNCVNCPVGREHKK